MQINGGPGIKIAPTHKNQIIFWPNQTKLNVTKQMLQKENPKVLLKVRFSGPIWQKLILFAFNAIFGI